MASVRSPRAASADLFDLPAERAHRPRRSLPWREGVAVALVVGAVLWCAWVTRALVAHSTPRPVFAAVRLQPLVAEFVAEQARNNQPEAQVARDTQAFMARLDAELQARGRAGTTVLVAEAVLSKDVPDITEQVRRAVRQVVPSSPTQSVRTTNASVR